MDRAVKGVPLGYGDLELELRLLPGVVNVGVAPGPGTTPVLTVAALNAESDLAEAIARVVRVSGIEATFNVLDLAVTAPSTAPPTAEPQTISEVPHQQANGAHHPAAAEHQARADQGARGDDGAGGRDHRHARALLQGRRERVERGERVALEAATFNTDTGMSVVHLRHGARDAVGESAAGPLVGGAEATLEALTKLGMDIPGRLLSVSTLRGITDSPVRVILRSTDMQSQQGQEDGENLIGVAHARTRTESACRATLNASNARLEH